MWQETNEGLYKEFTFNDFNEAFGFMTKVAAVAEAQQHHPRWENTYNTVKIWLNTHDAVGQITDKDRALAAEIDALLEAPALASTASALAKTLKVKIYADGGSRGNPGPSASGFVVLNPDDNKVLVDKGIYLGITTNNQAEYQALKFALEESLKMGAHEVDAYMDSLLVINQMKGIFKVKNRDLWPIHEAIKELVHKFKHVSFTHVPRELNKLADAAVNRALDEQLGIKPSQNTPDTI